MIGLYIPYKMPFFPQHETSEMPNVATVLKSEMARVARKEVRGETVPLKKAVSAYRSEIAALKRRAKILASQRRRLGLSSVQCGLLLGASDQSVHNWEQGKTRPLAKHMPAIATLRGMSKKDAAARLDSMQR